jgi:hypothetical protein
VSCGKTCSQETFSLRYFLKRPELLRPVAAGLVADSSHRQIARLLGCSHSTITRLSTRLGRHALLLLRYTLDHLHGRLNLTITCDHLKNFELTQDYPSASSRLSTAGGGYTGSATRTLDALLRLAASDDRLHIVSDDRPQFRQTIDRHPVELADELSQRGFTANEDPNSAPPWSSHSLRRQSSSPWSATDV